MVGFGVIEPILAGFSNRFWLISAFLNLFLAGFGSFRPDFGWFRRFFWADFRGFPLVSALLSLHRMVSVGSSLSYFWHILSLLFRFVSFPFLPVPLLLILYFFLSFFFPFHISVRKTKGQR